MNVHVKRIVCLVLLTTFLVSGTSVNSLELKKCIKDFSRTAIVRALTKLHDCELVIRVKKKDTASRKKNLLTRFMMLLREGKLSEK